MKLMRQYSGQVMTTLRKKIEQWFDTEAAINSFYKKAFDVSTAQGVWLDFWGKIVGQSRLITVTDSNDNPQSFFLEDEQFRLLIMLKAFSNLNMTTVPNLNYMLQMLFGKRGKAYIVDTGGMEITAVFDFPLKDIEIAILKAGTIPHPGGVRVNLRTLNGSDFFGFLGSDFQPFGLYENGVPTEGGGQAPFFTGSDTNIA